MRIAGLLLAAGRGARLGGDKFARRKDGRSLADHALAPLRRLPLAAFLAVTPAQADFLAADPSVRRIVNPDPDAGLSSSLRLGLEAAGDCDAVLVALADMPAVRPQTCSALIAAWRPGLKAAAPLHAGRRGNPVLVETGWARGIASDLTGDRGLGQALDALADGLARIEVDDPGILFDVDTAQDLERWLDGTV
jgi:molybdenum cofactor cytidylyltransferase